MGKVKRRMLFITLAIGAVPTAISFINGNWWLGTASMLLTLLVACFAFRSQMYYLVLTLYAWFAIAWLVGSVAEGLLPVTWNAGWRIVIALALGVIAGTAIPAFFWLAILFVSTKWVMDVSNSFDIAWRRALLFVASRAFGLGQAAISVENGAIAFEKPQGLLFKLGGPGILVVGVGNAVILERGGKVTRVEGPGIHQLARFEHLKTPVEGKGIVDLRPQFVQGVAEDVRTKDGIPLKIIVGEFFQVEPKQVTDGRGTTNHSARMDATSRVLGAPEYPVYENIVRKAVFKVPEEGWKAGLFPSEPIHHLRDVVATFALDDIFGFDQAGQTLSPDQRVIKAIEDEVMKRFSLVDQGVWFKGIDIRDITMPAEVEQRVLKMWTARVERDLKIAEAQAEADAMIERSRGRASAYANVEKVRARALDDVVDKVQRLLSALVEADNAQIAVSFVSVIQRLADQVGQDESVAIRYIEAMQAIIDSDGTKSFIISSPAASPGALPGPPPGRAGRGAGQGDTQTK